MSREKYGDPITELAALTRLLDYARVTATDLRQPILACLIQMASDESRSAADDHQQAGRVEKAMMS